MKEIRPFDLSALEKLAKIIGERYSGSEITELFRKAGFPNVQHDRSTKWKFVYASLEELQKQANGPYNVVKVIEKLCDPQEYFGRAEYRKSIVEKVNEILAFYSLEVSSETGKIAVKSNPSPTLRPQRSKAEEMFDSRNFHPEVQKHARSLFVEGKHFHAVFECCKAFDKYVREKSEIDKYGADLMGAALSLKGPLKINTQCTETERNEQEGIMHLCIGLMRAIRNPEAHEPELNWSITQEDALDILSLISFLWRKIDGAVIWRGTSSA